MGTATLARRTLLRTTALMMAIAGSPFARSVRAVPIVVPDGKIVLAWHTNIAARWLDPQQHDGGATPDNFLNVLHDALIKNFRVENYYLVLGFRHAAVNAIGPRIKAAKWQDVFPTITTAYAYPWEDVQLKA